MLKGQLIYNGISISIDPYLSLSLFFFIFACFFRLRRMF